MRIQACLNGGRSRSEHPGVPYTPEELAADARACVDAGADLLHFHPRDERGAETLEAGPCGNAVIAVRRACPGTPIVLSGGLWISRGDRRRRLELISGWVERPDAVAMTFADEGALEMIQALIGLGIGADAGLVTTAHAHQLAESGLGSAVERILVEPAERDPAEAVIAAAAIDDAVAELGPPRMYNGYADSTWSVLDAALDRGREVRIGFEDTLTMPDGHPARDNAELVGEAVRRRDERRAA